MDQAMRSAQKLEELSKWCPWHGLRFELSFAAQQLRAKAAVEKQLDQCISTESEAIDRWVFWKNEAIKLGHNGCEPGPMAELRGE